MHHQYGLFSFCGLEPDQVQRLRQVKGIYMPSNGRINIAGLNMQNVEYVADSLLSVM
jgi:aspartate/tyrosine/aromatic aminotransferase